MKKLKFLSAMLSIVLLSCLFAVPSLKASQITAFDFTAVEENGGTGTITGVFGWDSDVLGSDHGSGVWSYSTAGFVNATVLGGEFDGTSIDNIDIKVEITNDFSDPHSSSSYDQISMIWTVSQSSQTFPRYQVNGYLYLTDYSATALDDASLPGALDLSAFDSVTFEIFEYYRTSQSSSDSTKFVREDYIINSITQRPVPEPSTVFLFGIGLLGLARVNRRKK